VVNVVMGPKPSDSLPTTAGSAPLGARRNPDERFLIAASEHMRSDDEVMERARANGEVTDQGKSENTAEPKEEA
jgi:hypothetical protein